MSFTAVLDHTVFYILLLHIRPTVTTLVSLKEFHNHLKFHLAKLAHCEDLGLGVPEMRNLGMDSGWSACQIFVFTRLQPDPGDTLLFLSLPHQYRK